MSRERGIAKDAGLVMLLILFSRFLGYVRERAIADVFGLNIETDIFRLAFNIPDLMYFLLIAGGLNAAFIPVFTSYLANDQEEEGWRLASTFFSLILALLLLMVGLRDRLCPEPQSLGRLQLPRGREGSPRPLDAADVSRRLFHGAGRRRDGRAPLLPQLRASHVGPHHLQRDDHRLDLPFGTGDGHRRHGLRHRGGGHRRTLPSSFPLLCKRCRGKRLALDFSHPGLKQIFGLMGPAVVSLSIYQINFIIVSNLASGLAEGSPTALKIAQTMVQLAVRRLWHGHRHGDPAHPRPPDRSEGSWQRFARPSPKGSGPSFS